MDGLDWSPPKLFLLYLDACLCAHNHVSFWKNILFLHKWCYICLQNSFVCPIPLTVGWGSLSKSVHTCSDVILINYQSVSHGMALPWIIKPCLPCWTFGSSWWADSEMVPSDLVCMPLCNCLALTEGWPSDLLLINRIKQRRRDVTSMTRLEESVTWLLLADSFFCWLIERLTWQGTKGSLWPPAHK